jgi:hypothetical protein
MAAIRYLYVRMNTYQLSSENMLKVSNTIQQILPHKRYNTSIPNNLRFKKKQKQNVGKVQWAKFTCAGKEASAITKLFKNTNVKAAFSTNNTIGAFLATRHQRTKCKYENCGIYQLTCPTRNMKYIGQTGRHFKVCFYEHFCDFKYGNRKSRFTQHLLENGHSISPTESIMETIHITNKGQIMDTLERFYIFRVTRLNNQINYKLTIKSNIIFDTIVCRDPHRGLLATYDPSSVAPSSVLQDLHSCS